MLNSLSDFPVLFSYLAEAEQILLSTCVGELPKTGREAVLLALLEGQYFFRETVGATLAVDNEARFVTLQLARHLTLLSAENFLYLRRKLPQCSARFWRERLQSAAIGEKREESPHNNPSHTPKKTLRYDPVALMTMFRL